MSVNVVISQENDQPQLLHCAVISDVEIPLVESNPQDGQQSAKPKLSGKENRELLSGRLKESQKKKEAEVKWAFFQNRLYEKKIPYFILSMAFIQVCMFILLRCVDKTVKNKVELALVYLPHKRYEIWRYLTVLLIHLNWWHIGINTWSQIFCGWAVERKYNWRSVAVIYFGGVIFGTLCSSVLHPWSPAGGASAGVFALFIANFVTTLLYWKDLSIPRCRLSLFLIDLTICVGLSIGAEFIKGMRISHAGHLGGALGGFLLGVVVLKRRELEKWQIILQRVCYVLIFLFLFATIAGNVYFQDYYYKSSNKCFLPWVKCKNGTMIMQKT